MEPTLFTLTEPFKPFAVGETFKKINENATYVQLERKARVGSIVAIKKEDFLRCFTAESA